MIIGNGKVPDRLVTLKTKHGMDTLNQEEVRGAMLKKKIKPKMKIQSLSTQPRVEGKSSKVSWSAKHLWSFTAKQYGAIFLEAPQMFCGLI